MAVVVFMMTLRIFTTMIFIFMMTIFITVPRVLFVMMVMTIIVLVVMMGTIKVKIRDVLAIVEKASALRLTLPWISGQEFNQPPRHDGRLRCGIPRVAVR